MNQNQRRLWRTTINTLEEVANSEPVQSFTNIKHLVEKAAEDLRIEFGDRLVEHEMVSVYASSDDDPTDS